MNVGLSPCVFLHVLLNHYILQMLYHKVDMTVVSEKVSFSRVQTMPRELYCCVNVFTFTKYNNNNIYFQIGFLSLK